MSKAFGKYLFGKYLVLARLGPKPDLQQYPGLQIIKALGGKDNRKPWTIVYEFYMVSLHDYVSCHSNPMFTSSWVCLALSQITGILYSRCTYTYSDFKTRGYVSNRTLSEHLVPFCIDYDELCPSNTETQLTVTGSFWSDSPELTDRQWLTRRFVDYVKEVCPDWKMPKDVFSGGLFNDGGVHFLATSPPLQDEQESRGPLVRIAAKASRK